ncbi:expressed unknown protein [Seminavis robusta]|uniref:Uncharacterized protein n=1 Tax=Seminavis robusta TaxID=568900 RepID=A0A9N8H5Y8_9STRA|nr:expressed unknown protein [Seminavis robusta]|eukprot:Sro129_g061430.1 n/a (581) ;mRNA; f:2280-4138
MTMTIMISKLILLLLLPVLATGVRPHTLWFFGNSYTKNQGMVGMARCFYTLETQRLDPPVLTVHTPAYTPGGATLQNHIAYLRDDPNAPFFDNPDEIYPWVLLQEQSIYPSIPAYLQDSIRAANDLSFFFWLRPVQDVMFIMTWGGRGGHIDSQVNYPSFLAHNDALFEGYRQMVQTTSTNHVPRYMAPCGLTFATIHNDCVDAGLDPQDPEVCLFARLYVNDGRHPSRIGAYACAATIGASMTGIHPDTTTCLPRQGDGINEEEAYVVRMAVEKTIRETFESGLINYKFDTIWPAPDATAPTVPATQPPVPAVTMPPAASNGNGPPDETPGNGPPEPVPGIGPPESITGDEEVPDCWALPPPADGSCLPANPSTIDDGMPDAYRGWYSLNNDGCCQDFCRWNGYSGPGGDPSIQTTHENSFWACRPAGYSTCTYWRNYLTPFTATRCLAQGVPAVGTVAPTEAGTAAVTTVGTVAGTPAGTVAGTPTGTAGATTGGGDLGTPAFTSSPSADIGTDVEKKSESSEESSAKFEQYQHSRHDEEAEGGEAIYLLESSAANAGFAWSLASRALVVAASVFLMA